MTRTRTGAWISNPAAASQSPRICNSAHREGVGLSDDVVNDLFGVIAGIGSDEVVDGPEVGLGRLGPDHHDLISAFKSSLLMVWPCSAASWPLRILSST